MYAFRITSRYLRGSVLKTVYHATIESRVRFGLCFYGSENISSLFILQKRAVRILYNKKFNEPCRGVFRQNKILTIYAIYIQECLLFFHKNKELFSKYKFTTTRYETRTQAYGYPKCRLATSQKQLEYRCIKLFNNLPSEIQKIENHKLFKKELYKMLVDREPYTLKDFGAEN